MTANSFGCKVCRLPLSTFLDEYGEVHFRHPPSPLASGHEPQPTPGDDFRDGLIGVCDFCAGDDLIVWQYLTSPITMIAYGDAANLVNDYGTIWGACARCAALIESRDLARLCQINLTAVGMSPHDPAAHAGQQMLATVLQEIRPGRTLLLDGRPGEPPQLEARCLPRIRDRLAVLLAPDNVIPAFGPDPYAQKEVADGLMMARHYAIDDTFTRMAVAAAEALHDVSLSTIRVPAPFGFVLWSHPVNSADAIAASWTTVGSSLRIAYYRPLHAAPSTAQQQLREQAGWLLPLSTATVHPGEPLDSGHPSAVLIATFLLIAHRLAESAGVSVDRRIRRSYLREGRPAPEVRLVHLRPAARPSAGNADESAGDADRVRREPEYRWWCAPFTRNQRRGPGLSEVETILVLPFINGPRGKPVRASTTVRLLAQPKSKPTSNTAEAVSHVDGDI